MHEESQSKIYGSKLRKLRQSRDMSQLDLEVLTGLSVGSISRMENNRINPTKETLFRIAVVLQLTAQETADLLCINENLVQVNTASGLTCYTTKMRFTS